MRSSRWRCVRNFLLGCFVASAVWLAWHSNAQVSIEVLGLSRHSEPGYCEQNVGAGVVYELVKDVRLAAIRYRNSLCHPSNAIGFCYTPIHLGRVSIGACPVRLTGYGDKPLYLPIPLVSIAIDKTVSVDAVGGAKNGRAVIGTALRFAF